MTIQNVKWTGLVILSFATLSVFGVQSSFDSRKESPKPASAPKEETLKMLSSYRTWDRINKQPFVLFKSDLAFAG